MDFRPENRLKNFLHPQAPEEKLYDDGLLSITKVNTPGKKVHLDQDRDFLSELAKAKGPDDFLLNVDKFFRLMDIKSPEEKNYFRFSLTQHKQNFLSPSNEVVDESAQRGKLSPDQANYINELAEIFMRIENDQNLSIANYAQDLHDLASLYEKNYIASAIQKLVPDQKLNSKKLETWNELQGHISSSDSEKEKALKALTEMLRERQGFTSENTKIRKLHDLEQEAKVIDSQSEISPAIIAEFMDLDLGAERELFNQLRSILQKILSIFLAHQ
jgi:hypothetical protein